MEKRVLPAVDFKMFSCIPSNETKNYAVSCGSIAKEGICIKRKSVWVKKRMIDFSMLVKHIKVC